MRFARAERRRAQRAAEKAKKPSLPARIDLLDWVRFRGHLSRRRAMLVILAGSLRVDSHPIGVKLMKTASGDMRVLDRYVPASYRGKIEIVRPEIVDEPD